MGLSDQLQAFRRKTINKVDRVVSESVKEIAAEGVRQTPRQTGLLASSVEVTQGLEGPPELPTMTADEGASFAASRPAGDVSQAETIKAGDVGRISWRAPYAISVEHGTSKQAGHGMAAYAAARGNLIIDEVAKKIAAER